MDTNGNSQEWLAALTARPITGYLVMTTHTVHVSDECPIYKRATYKTPQRGPLAVDRLPLCKTCVKKTLATIGV